MAELGGFFDDDPHPGFFGNGDVLGVGAVGQSGGGPPNGISGCEGRDPFADGFNHP
jgi:hypothetical protein